MRQGDRVFSLPLSTAGSAVDQIIGSGRAGAGSLREWRVRKHFSRSVHSRFGGSPPRTPGRQRRIRNCRPPRGVSAALLSLVGADRKGEVVCGILRDVGVETGSVVVDSHRRAIVKERFLGSVQSADSRHAAIAAC